MVNWGLVVLVFSVLSTAAALGFILWVQTWERRRARALQETAEVLGMEFQPQDSAPVRAFLDAFEEFPLFQRAPTTNIVRNVMWAQADDELVMVFDFSFTIGTGKNRHVYRQTVVGCQSPHLSLPTLRIDRQRWYHAVGKLFGMQDVDWDEHPEFSRQFRVQGDELALRSWLKLPFVQALLENPNFSVEGKGQKMLLYRLGHLVKAINMKEFLREAYRIIGAAKEAC